MVSAAERVRRYRSVPSRTPLGRCWEEHDADAAVADSSSFGTCGRDLSSSVLLLLFLSDDED